MEVVLVVGVVHLGDHLCPQSICLSHHPLLRKKENSNNGENSRGGHGGSGGLVPSIPLGDPTTTILALFTPELLDHIMKERSRYAEQCTSETHHGDGPPPTLTTTENEQKPSLVCNASGHLLIRMSSHGYRGAH